MAPSPGACWTISWATSGFSVEGVSGTSAGAVNAVMLADGLTRGGREEAQKRLADFWRAVSSNGNLPARAARGDGTDVVVHAARRHADAGLVRCGVALFLSLRRQSAQHQSVQGSDRPLRRFRGVARQFRPAALRIGDQCADRPGAHLSARQDHGRRGDGVGLPAAPLSRRRDRRRALLGRRLSRQPGDLSVLSHHHDGRRAGGPDQSAGAEGDADLAPARS